MRLKSMGKGKDLLSLIELPLTCFNNILPMANESETRVQIYAVNPITKKKLIGYLQVEVKDEDGKRYASLFPEDEDVLIALMEYSYLKNRFESPKVKFDSLAEIIDLLGWHSTGRYYNKLIQSLIRLKTVQITTDLFWNTETRTYQYAHISILSNVYYDHMDAYGYPIKNKKTGGHFEWDPTIFKSIDSGYIKSIDTDFYRSLKWGIPRKLWRILDKRFYKYSQVYLPLEYLAVDVFRLKERHQSYYRQQLKKYCNELVKKGYLGKYWFDHKNYVEHLFCEKTGAQQQIFDTTLHLDVNNLKTIEVYEALLKFGIDKKQAARMVNTFEIKTIAMWLDCFDKGFKEADNPVAYLINAIHKSYDLPRNYTEYLDKLQNKKDKVIQLDQIANCQLCDASGWRYLMQNFPDGTTREVAMKCSHKTNAEPAPLFEDQ